ncbi:hypothetical protein [Pseudomonas sp. B5(2017)]|uniref:hypothetical protein n=1 Tax=Pseudomonas sp. B5(2017) TaxID=1981714 RepID=UPI00111C481D|nr:hypothetical protein [Pseudomonas sp. B5(2017)]
MQSEVKSRGPFTQAKWWAEGSLIGQKQNVAETKIPAQGGHFWKGRNQENLHRANKIWCGDRRTVVGSEGPVFVGLEFGGFLDVPHRTPTNKSASYGFPWNRTGKILASMKTTTARLKSQVGKGKTAKRRSLMNPTITL